ncbi:MAG TPA: cytochrome c oxidase assembly protein, partial [Ktedonobacteraceae bacterium]|nr:cytochrome c oxidase assembly protein [Ktedonobacteraceae bacterium]
YHLMLWSIFLTSLLSWWPLIGAGRQLHSLSYPAKMLYTFLDAQPLAFYALLIVFGGVVLYPYAIPRELPLDAFADQAAAGALLLIPGFVDLIVMSPFFFRWLAQIEERARLNDERRQALLESQQGEVQEEVDSDIYEGSAGMAE